MINFRRFLVIRWFNYIKLSSGWNTDTRNLVVQRCQPSGAFVHCGNFQWRHRTSNFNHTPRRHRRLHVHSTQWRRTGFSHGSSNHCGRRCYYGEFTPLHESWVVSKAVVNFRLKSQPESITNRHRTTIFLGSAHKSDEVGRREGSVHMRGKSDAGKCDSSLVPWGLTGSRGGSAGDSCNNKEGWHADHQSGQRRWLRHVYLWSFQRNRRCTKCWRLSECRMWDLQKNLAENRK